MEVKVLIPIVIIVVGIVAFAAGFYSYPMTAKPPEEKPTVTEYVTVTSTTTVPAVKRDVWEDVVERGYIVVGTSPDWPPFEYLDPKTGELIGFEVELMEMIAKELGLEVKWKTMDFATIIPSVKNKDIDLGVSGFSITPERLEEVRFTIPHTITECQLIMVKERAEELGITRLKDLSEIAKYKLVVGAGSGTTQEAELMDLISKGVIPSGSLRPYERYDVALEDLLMGRIDAIYAETPITTWWGMTVEKDLVVVYSRSYWPVAFVAHKDADILVSKINGVLAKLISEGKVDELREKWSKPRE